jgi:hypothetical protein
MKRASAAKVGRTHPKGHRMASVHTNLSCTSRSRSVLDLGGSSYAPHRITWPHRLLRHWHRRSRSLGAPGTGKTPSRTKREPHSPHLGNAAYFAISLRSRRQYATSVMTKKHNDRFMKYILTTFPFGPILPLLYPRLAPNATSAVQIKKRPDGVQLRMREAA